MTFSYPELLLSTEVVMENKSPVVILLVNQVDHGPMEGEVDGNLTPSSLPVSPEGRSTAASDSQFQRFVVRLAQLIDSLVLRQTPDSTAQCPIVSTDIPVTTGEPQKVRRQF